MKYCEFEVSSGSGYCRIEGYVLYDPYSNPDAFYHIHHYQDEDEAGIGIERLDDLVSMKEVDHCCVSDEELKRCLQGFENV